MILVTPLSAVETTIRRYRPSHMVTLLSPEHMIETPDGFPPEAHLRLGVNDVADPAFGDTPPAGRACRTSCSPSAAAGTARRRCWCIAGPVSAARPRRPISCSATGLGRAAKNEIAKAIRFRAPHAYPNRLMVQLADAALGREGRMLRAVEALGRGRIVAEGECVELPLVAGGIMNRTANVVRIGLSAAIVSVAEEVPRVLAVGHPERRRRPALRPLRPVETPNARKRPSQLGARTDFSSISITPNSSTPSAIADGT